MWPILAALLFAASAFAQPVEHFGPAYVQCKEVPPGTRPPAGDQLLYCKQGGAGFCTMNSSGSESCTGGSTSYLPINSFSGVDCTGATASNAGAQTALNSLANTGSTIFLPPGCKLGLSSPGAGGVALTIPNNLHILCADQSAGFFAQEQFCTGGSFGPSGVLGIFGGAKCNTNADCPGGGTCVSSFGAGAGAACTGSTCFAPSSGSTYTMLQDASTISSDIVIENCSFWPNQADPFQRCAGGSNAGLPCRQECALGSVLSGARCDTNGDCLTGTCDLSRTNCTTGGGSCTGAPLSPAGLGNINVLDLGRTTGVKLYNVSVYDHLLTANSTAGFGVRTGAQATIVNSNFAREITDCTSPFTTPTDSLCFSTNNGLCCYGGAQNVFAAANKNNTQPTTQVFQDVATGTDSQLTRVYVRASSSAITVGDRSRIDESTVIPRVLNGPGSPSNGFTIGNYSQVAKSQGLFLNTNATGVAMSGTAAGVIANKFAFATGATGGACVTSSGNEFHIVSQICEGLGTGGTAINVTGGTAGTVIANTIIMGPTGTQNGIVNAAASAIISDNYINPNFATGTAIKTTGASAHIVNNDISTVGGSGIGIDIEAASVVSDNLLNFTASSANQTGIKLNAGFSYIGSNNVAMATAEQNPSNHQTIIAYPSAGSQNRIEGNYFSGGWRGIDEQGTGNGALTNTLIVSNRFVSLGGAAFSLGGAGVFIGGNYVNRSGQSRPTLVCDASCTGGNLRGHQCEQDTDCTTCNGAVFTCIPEPNVGFANDAMASSGTASSNHNSWFGNVVFAGQPVVKQCSGTATNPGALCETAANTCGGGGTCTATGGFGVLATCVGGTEASKACCLGAAPVCSQRTPTPWIRFPDLGTTTAWNQFNFFGNTVFGGSGLDSNVMLDFISSANLGNITFTHGSIASNVFDGAADTNKIAIKLPTSGTINQNSIAANNFTNFTGAGSQAIQNFQGGYGSLSLVNGQAKNGAALQEVTTLATDEFFPVDATQTGAQPTEATVQEIVGASAQVYRMTCMTSVAPGNTNATRTIVLRKNGADTAFTCTIGTAATTCNANTVSQVGFAATDLWDYRTRCNVSACAGLENLMCVMYISYDGLGVL